jgi:alpha-2-macroglobulin
MRAILGWGALALVAFLPIAAISEPNPQVTLATAGSGGNSGGAINRFTIRFSEAMVPLGDPRAVAPGKVECAVPATGRWVDGQTWVADFERPLPGGLTCKITLNENLKSARGASVGGTTSFQIDTGGPSARSVLAGDGGDVEEDQVFLVATNTPAAPKSIAAAGYCTVDGIGDKIALDVLGRDVAAKLLADLGPDNWDARNFLENAGLPQTVSANAAERAKALSIVTAVKCRRPLPPGRDMALVWAAGIANGEGRTSGRDQRYDFSVRKAFAASFECGRTNPQAGCSPLQKAYVRFTSPVPTDQAKAIRLTFADGTALSPMLSDDDQKSATVSSVFFKAPLPAEAKGTVTIPDAMKDESGRSLSNAQRFPLEVRVDAAPPLVKFAAPFGIVEANEGGVLPVTVRAVEANLAPRIDGVMGDRLRVDATDGEVAAWLRKLDNADDNEFREEKRGKEMVSVNYTGTTSLLKGQGTDLQLGLPGGGKSFEVVGIPLKAPGFYVVELASPTLGKALLGRSTTRYVSAGALVTNMAVHFKWGRDRSLAWVTTLDGAVPVGGADVRVTDSCSGIQIARGMSDKEGRLVVTGLPSPETSGSCDKDSEDHPLMISARKSGDFSFTMTQWNDGIRPYDFDLPYGWSEQDDIIHTVFDRTLVRQGETVNMKHILRKPIGEGFAYGTPIKGKLRLTHRGSDTEFDLPLSIGADGVGETSWTAPQGAPQGDYDLAIITAKDTIYTDQSVRVDEFRLPTMRATVSGPKANVVRPTKVPVDLFVGYLSGGPAAGLPVSLRTAFTSSETTPDGWEGWTFGGRMVKEGVTPLNGDGEEQAAPLPLSQTLPVTLGQDGTAKTVLDIAQEIEGETTMTVEMDYQDANGETLTATRYIPLLSSAVQLGVKTDGWMMRDNDLRLKIAALGPEGQAIKGRPVKVELYSREVLTARRRLIGGFYAYDNQMRTKRLGGGCTVTTDSKGMAACAFAPGISGEVTVVATTTDANGNTARAVRDVWLAGEDDWWFGGDNGDRMDLLPEQKEYKAGDTAKFQVRMPFREATALVTVEREGVMSSYVTQLSGTDPVVKVKMPASYAPDVYVSVLAVRGRIGGFKLWTAKIARDWNLPFLSRDGYAPSALVDLAKPSYRLGMAKVKVGWEGYKLGVKVKADKARYAVRETANVDVQVTDPGGKPAKSAEIAFAAVDEALLQLSPNDSWALLDAMMGERPLSVLTSTAQTQIVGKRHYGKKAVEAGGGGGDASAATRTDFKPVLLWRGRVALDGQGKARLPVALSDSLSSFRLVAIANGGANLFGTGETKIRTAQDLSIFSGIPPLVRTGDFYGASFTLRNGTDKPMSVTANVKVTPAVANGAPLTVIIPAGGSAPVTWNLAAPVGVSSLNWEVEATAANGKATDRIAVTQAVIPAVPVEVWAATLTRVGANTSIPLMAPAGALPGFGFVDVKLTDTLAPPLIGVRDYMTAYPYNCFEQQTSRLVVMGDGAGWDKLAATIPAYLDSDGLLRYFPMADLRGSEALTAYILSVTAEAGFVVPETAKAKMIEAMKAVVDGRLKRDYPWASDDRQTRIAALAALARNGASTPAMLGQTGLAPADMTTAVLADWLTIIDRTPGTSPALRVAAETVLRQRLVYEGSRLDLTDKDSASWWMMTSGDEMAIKALIAVMGRPGWSEEEPKMMIGVALRQQRGHWDTTPANAWGTIAAKKFATRYPASAISGMTTVSLGAQTLSQGWPMAPGTGPLRLALPMAKTPLVLNQAGGAGPWAMVSLSAAVPLKQALFAGYRIEKTVSVVSQKNADHLTRGDVVKVRITVDAGVDRNWVVVSDPVPPGATIIGNLGGQSALLAASASGGEGAQPSYVERGNDAWRGYFEWVPEGRFVVEYAMRLNGSGQFTLPATRVEAMYSPDIRGLVPNAPVKVEMR